MAGQSLGSTAQHRDDAVAVPEIEEHDEGDQQQLQDAVAEDPDEGERKAAGRTTQSVEDLRFRAGTTVDTWLTPTLWSGMSHLAYGSAWVGSYESLSDLFVEYAQAGVSMFQMYGYPFLEEAFNVGERFLPIVKAKLAREQEI